MRRGTAKDEMEHFGKQIDGELKTFLWLAVAVVLAVSALVYLGYLIGSS